MKKKFTVEGNETSSLCRYFRRFNYMKIIYSVVNLLKKTPRVGITQLVYVYWLGMGRQLEIDSWPW
jgi:hypothetical protein